MNKYAAHSRLAKKARHRARSCEQKVRFATEAEARANPYKQDVYACRFCGGWHCTGAVHKTARLIRSKGRAIL